MPEPTREEFEATAQRVAQSAPAGLSREAFYQRVENELSQSRQTGEDRVTNLFGGPQTASDYPSSASSNGPSFVGRLQAMLEPAAHPQTMGDFGALMLPTDSAVTGSLRAITALPKAGRNLSGRLMQMAGKAIDIGASPLPPMAKPHALTVAAEQLQRLGTNMQDVPFSHQPVYRQMEQLPELARPFGVGRMTEPPMRVIPQPSHVSTSSPISAAEKSPLNYLTGTAMVDASPAERMMLAKQRALLQAAIRARLQR